MSYNLQLMQIMQMLFLQIFSKKIWNSGMKLCTCSMTLSNAWASKQYCVWLRLMIQRRWLWRKRKNVLQIATEAWFHLGVPGTVRIWFLVACPPQDTVALHVSHFAPGLQEQEIQICRVERARTHSVRVPRLTGLNIAGVAVCLSWMRI